MGVDIRAHHEVFRHCYEQALACAPTLNGGIAVQFTLQSDGRVSDARATENTVTPALLLVREALASCVVRVYYELDFDFGFHDGSLQFSYPFIFAPED